MERGRDRDAQGVARVDGVDRDGLRDLATALRDTDGIRAVVLGSALDSGGAALVALVRPDCGLEAPALVSDARPLIKGGGNLKNPLQAELGGANAEGLDDALDLARAAAGLG